MGLRRSREQAKSVCVCFHSRHIYNFRQHSVTVVALEANGAQSSTAPLLSLLANIQMARASSAPKLIIDARE